MIVAFAGRVARGAASFRSRIRLQMRLAGIRKDLEFPPGIPTEILKTKDRRGKGEALPPP